MAFKWGPLFLFVLALGAMGIGALFYAIQLSKTPPLLMLFVPDCPLYAALAAILILWHFPRNEIYRFVIACATAMYGAWTIFVILLYSNYYFIPDQAWLSYILLAGHLGMVLLGLLVLPKKPAMMTVGVAAGWLLLNTFVDYRLGNLSTHPWMPIEHLGVVEMFTWISAIAWPLLLFYLADWIREQKVLRTLHRSLCWICE